MPFAQLMAVLPPRDVACSLRVPSNSNDLKYNKDENETVIAHRSDCGLFLSQNRKEQFTMSEPSNGAWPFQEIPEEEGLDISAIFGDSSAVPQGDPFAPPAAAQSVPSSPTPVAQEITPAVAATLQPTTAPIVNTPAKAPAEAPAENPIAAAFEQKTAENTKKGLLEKPPVFYHKGVKEEIDDPSMTFEELRIRKSDDFTDLEEGKRVSWSVEYCGIRKEVKDPKGTTIISMKEMIERSREFLDALKKTKDKDPCCYVKPKVEMKTKGNAAYFSLANLLVDKDELSSLCESMGIPYTGSTRLSLGDAFRSATGDIRERVPVTVDGETNIYLAYCRDNKRTAGVFSRELVKETLNRETNRYEKLANISCGKSDGMFRCDNLVLDDAVDVQGCCRKAEELFELYQRCANRKQIETICVNFLRGMEATKLSVTGHMYFVPRTFMERVDIFEDFITLLSGLNKKQTPLVVNSFYIIDDAKQRDKMTEEFYLAVKKEIAAYQEKCDYLIKSSSQSPAVMERWVLKVQALEEKKRHYEGVLQRELDGLDDEFSVLKLLSQELQVRARSIRSQRFQQRAA